METQESQDKNSGETSREERRSRSSGSSRDSSRRSSSSSRDRDAKDVKKLPPWIPGPTGWLWSSSFSIIGMFFAWGNPLTKPMQLGFLLWCLLPFVFLGWWLFSGKFRVSRGDPLRKMPHAFAILTVLVYWIPFMRSFFDSTGEFVVFSPLPFWLAFAVAKGVGKWVLEKTS